MSRIRPPLVLTLLVAATFTHCTCNKPEDPPPLPVDSSPVPSPPPPSATGSVNIVPAPPLPNQSPGTLGEAILLTRPRMSDFTGTPDEGSSTLLTYWLDKKYPWAQLEATPATTEAAFLANPDAERGKRICTSGVVQQLSQVSPQPPRHDGVQLAQSGVSVSFGAVGDVAGIKQGGPGKFCGIATGIQTMTAPDGKQTRAIRSIGMFDTPANRGATGGGGLASLKACCQALQQNSASMPPPQNMYAAAAAQYCNASAAAVSSPQQKDALLAGIRGALRGAAMPGACR
jgi:hypothetical protein